MKHRTTVITLANQKGGSGKTTSCHALGAGLTRRGYKVLFVDLDAQANLSYTSGIGRTALSSMEVLTGTAKAEEAIQTTPAGDIIPASSVLAEANSIITDTGREYKLKEALEPIKGNYDFILLDTSPARSILTVNSFTASDKLVIPAEANAYSVQGIGGLSETITAVKKYCNPNLVVSGVLLTRYNPRAVLTRDFTSFAEQVAASLDTRVYKTKIRENISLKEAQALQTDIFSYAPKSNGAIDYNSFVDEFLQERK